MSKEQEMIHRRGQIVRIIYKCTRKWGFVPKEKFINFIQYEFGITRRTALNYVKVLVANGLVDDTNGELIYIKQKNGAKEEADKILASPKKKEVVVEEIDIDRIAPKKDQSTKASPSPSTKTS